VRLFAAGICCFLLLSCREIRQFQPIDIISGYELQGEVTSKNGIPLDSVSVRLYYTYDYLGPQQLDTIPVIITDSTKIVFVAVYSKAGAYVQTLYFNFHSPGILPTYLWDGRGEGGEPVPSGEYVIVYSYGSTVVKQVPVIADGNVTATTDRNGNFTLPNSCFPVGGVFGMYADNGEYVGAFRVLQDVEIVLRRGEVVSAPFDVTMTKDLITRRVFTFQ
jgi:hypothetical protein